MPATHPEPCLRAEIANLSSYQAGNHTQGVLLDNMENPFCSVDKNLLLSAFDKARQLNRYPDSQQIALKQSVANYFAIDPSQLLFGNGSDELILLLSLAVGQPQGCILSVCPSFSVYRLMAVAASRQFISVPLHTDFSLNLPRILQTIEQHQPCLSFFAYPNNPTGNLFDKKALMRILEATAKCGVVVIDEAYFAFAEESFLQQVNQYSHLIVMRTFSKIGFAGLRLGFIYAQPYWLEHINKIRLPYNINSLSQAILTEVLKQPQVFEKSIQIIKQQRQHLQHQLRQLPEIECFASQANFLLLRTRATSKAKRHQRALAIYQYLAQQQIHIRLLSQPEGLLNGCLRVSIGKQPENQLFVDALITALGHNSGSIN